MNGIYRGFGPWKCDSKYIESYQIFENATVKTVKELGIAWGKQDYFISLILESGERFELSYLQTMVDLDNYICHWLYPTDDKGIPVMPEYTRELPYMEWFKLRLEEIPVNFRAGQYENKETASIELLRNVISAEIGKLTSELKPGKLITNKNSHADYFIKACEEHKTDRPTVKMLAEISNFSKSKWSKDLKIPKILLSIIDEVRKKTNQAKSSDKRELWVKVMSDLDTRASKAVTKINKGKTKRYKSDND